MKLLVLNGPNLNMLGIREPELYGKQDFNALISYINEICDTENISVSCYQSNHEGDLVDKIQEAYKVYDAILINPGAYTHTSVAILDALKAVGLPVAEVHLTDIETREDFRKISYVSYIAKKTFKGKGFESYKEAILFLNDLIK